MDHAINKIGLYLETLPAGMFATSRASLRVLSLARNTGWSRTLSLSTTSKCNQDDVTHTGQVHLHRSHRFFNLCTKKVLPIAIAFVSCVSTGRKKTTEMSDSWINKNRY